MAQSNFPYNKKFSLEEFIGIVVGRKTGIITMVFILMFNISVSVCGVIFSGKNLIFIFD
jgi:hypothetical protein